MDNIFGQEEINDAFLGLDLDDVKEVSFEPMPKGKYHVVVIDSELKDTKDLTGRYIKVVLEVQGGEFDGRKLFHNFNIQNANPMATQIGLGQLKKMMRVSGKTSFQLKSPVELCGLHVTASVGIKKDDQGESNIVKDFFPVQVSEPEHF